MCCFLVLKTHKWEYAALKIIKSLHTYMWENDDQSLNSSCVFSPRSGPYPSSSDSSWRVCPRAWPHSVSRWDWGRTKISRGYGWELRPLYHHYGHIAPNRARVLCNNHTTQLCQKEASRMRNIHHWVNKLHPLRFFQANMYLWIRWGCIVIGRLRNLHNVMFRSIFINENNASNKMVSQIAP